jgi:hypothetical protein
MEKQRRGASQFCVVNFAIQTIWKNGTNIICPFEEDGSRKT